MTVQEHTGTRARQRDDRRMLLAQRVEASLNGADEKRRQQILFMSESVLKRADDELLNRHPAEGFYAHIVNALESVLNRADGQIKTGCSFPGLDTHGYELPTYVLETCMADQPFIVDTIKLVLRRLEVRILGTLNMILPVRRAENGDLLDMSMDLEGAANESFTCHLLSAGTTRGREQLIKQTVHRHLERAVRVVGDFRRMQRVVRDVDTSLRFTATEQPERKRYLDEVTDFGEWLLAENFVFMGAFRFDGDGNPIARVGLGHFDDSPLESDPAATLGGDAPLVSIAQTRIDSPVHREGRMQEIRIRTFDEDGNSNGGVIFQGLFTYNGLTAAASNVPVLRMRLQRMVEAEELVPRSHRMKLFIAFFNRLPLTYTFAASDEEIRGLINEAIDVDFGGTARLHSFAYPQRELAHVFVMVTAGHYGERLRWRVQREIKRRFQPDYVKFRLLAGKTDATLWHFELSSDDRLAKPDLGELNDRVVTIVSPWLERMRQMLASLGVDEHQIDRWCGVYGDALHDEYCQRIEARHLLADLQAFDRVHATGDYQLFVRQRSDGKSVRLIVHSDTDNALTDILPVIDNFGLRVQGEKTVEMVDAEGRSIFMETYRIPIGERQGSHLLDHREPFLEGIRAALDGRMNSSTLNLLLLPARLDWRQLQILRAYIGYARQVGAAFPPNLVQSVFHSNPACVNVLLDYFHARFSPELDGKRLSAHDDDRKAKVGVITDAFYAALSEVESAVEDKILRMFFNLISATLRTNFYQRPDVARGLSFKLRCADVEIMNDPRPLYEIYVYEPNVEGVHLRGGPVARGGLRWSDRPDDFRTEILGLMLTQMVKNTLIVPVGSKGGFVLKKPIADYAERRKRADELYEVFINGLLDVTDNLVDGKPVFPEDVVTYDGADPYLVVAADKGTAHLSDTANRIATQRGFWLGDAFASGGSQGYDHKVYGITAKGAWVCVQRLFRELGVDTQKDRFTCVGIGDMSGDVFGNGMLLSRSMALLGAFNHMHIFIDPTPDVDKSYAERKRLFDLGRSSWADYDRSIISKGGGVWDRGAKSIPLTDAVQKMLGTKRTEMSGTEIVKAMLMADVDLLWNGGIGTYVKASFETHSDVGDKANDDVRVDATELRCRVVGEGGNLGCTHASRVEFSLRGGRITSDAVDNSGGVDLSDHEVNLKVLFAPLLQAKTIDTDARNELLFEVDELVCADVLHDNYQHTLGISVAETESPRTISNWNTAIVFLADKLGIDRDLQLLPTRDILKERRNASLGLTRPEIARIVAFAKMWLFEKLSADRACSQHVAREYLDAYFPAAVRERFPDAVTGHKLAHEIICTVWCNEVVDFAGALLMPNLAVEYERPAAVLCNAYSLAVRVLDVRRMRADLMRLDGKMEATLQYRAFAEIERSVAAATRGLLAMYPGDRLHAALGRSDELRALADEMSERMAKSPNRSQRNSLRSHAGRWQKLGLPRQIARDLARLKEMTAVFAVDALSRSAEIPASKATALWFSVAEQTGIGALINGDTGVPGSRWEAAATASLRQDLTESMLALAKQAAAKCGDDRKATAAVRKMLKNGAGLADICELARHIPAERNPMPALVVLTTRLRTILPANGG